MSFVLCVSLAFSKMPRINKFNRSHKFYGNRFTSGNSRPNLQAMNSSHILHVNNTTRPRPNPVENASNPSQSTSKSVPKQVSSSTKKLSQSKLPYDFSFDNNDINIIANLQLMSKLVKSFTKCRFCDNVDCVSLVIDNNYRNGLAHRLIIQCNKCNNSKSDLTSNNIRSLSEVNTRFLYALRSIGCGISAGKMFTAIMNLSPPNTKVKTYTARILQGTREVSEASMRNAVAEAVEENEGQDEIAAAFDGTWQKRGHTSLNGVVTVTSFDTGKVIDFECLSKFCVACVNKKNVSNLEQMRLHKLKCSANYTGSSGGMEVVGAKRICSRSVDKLGVKYTKYLGDGDSKGFEAVLEDKPYGEDVVIEKLECVGHVQKRLGTRLRKLKTTMKNQKLSDGKGLGGKGRLTDDKIDTLQQYYGKAIRKNLEDTNQMKRAIWATFFHTLSTDENPNHALCPKGVSSWCGYNKAQELNTIYSHKNYLPEAIMKTIKPIYRDLTKPELLKRCLHGKTQNPNESFNSCIWQRIKKTGFVGLQTLRLGVQDALITFNEGAIAKANVLDRLGIKPGRYTLETLKIIDRDRRLKADKEAEEGNKKQRIRRRLLKRKMEDPDNQDYCPGGF